MLSRLQLQVAEIVAGLAEAAGFALAGGAALSPARQIPVGVAAEIVSGF